MAKTAQAGAMMYRRADVMHVVARLNRHARAAMDLAKNEGRYDDAEVHAARMRAATTLREHIIMRLPVFINQQAVEAEPSATASSQDPRP